MPTPSTPQEFKDSFESWPKNSLATRKNPLGPGSSWDMCEIETFQILRKPSKKRFPLLLGPYIREAVARIEEYEEIQSAIRLSGQNWRNCTHQQLSERAGKFASFFTFLAQVLETPLSSDPRREVRSQVTQYSANSVSSALSSSPPQPPSLSSPSSPIQPPKKKMRQDRSSESYIPSDQSDQSSHDHRDKSEITTNACVYELLRCITELLRNKPDPPVYLEWSITHDTFTVEAGALVYSTTNDGSLVHKTKSWYHVDEKPSSVQAQEAAHLIGMFSQGASDGSSLHHETILPLVSAAQNVFSLVFGKFPPEYARYLRDGYQSEDGVFVELDECGMFELQDPSDLRTVFTIIVALHLWLQSVGPKL
ncbi:hypothetical protein G7Y89_g8940 [Cudoniella acicularis]|uniref:Uncharacterized protein n=1 Tax=Cudoniella acicularis TaxID=354080 RepID=A0A8H4RIG2_9HELO|nr:hypothetical protein G7Y89_g8940 [Cudoniella acicularis]